MHTSTASIDQLANALVSAYRSGQPLQTRPDLGPASEAEAYAVQHAVWRIMVGDARPTAWKLGAPSRESTPIAAPIFSGRIGGSPGQFPADSFLRLGVETEIALRFGCDLPTRPLPYRREEILDAVASAHVAMELVDSRLVDPDAAGPLWRLADSLLNGGLVLGSAIPDWRDLDLDALVARAYADDTLLAEAIGQQPLGDIYCCLPWWLGHIGGIRAGDIVTTGSWNGAPRITQPGSLRVEFAGLGRADVHLLQDAATP
jgi:2-keto-4-pentenoate hydratase